MDNYDIEKLTKLGALKALAERVNTDFSTKTELNTLEEKVEELVTTGGEPNKIEKIKVNGDEQFINSLDKSIDINVPTKVSDLNNDSKFQKDTEVQATVDAAINKFMTDVSDDDTVNTYKELVDYAAKHKGEAATMAGDIAKNKADIIELKTDVDGKVDKVNNKQLSTEDYTTEDKNKLDSIEFANISEVLEMLDEVFSVK